MTPLHVSVLPREVIAFGSPQPGETWVDATCGVGGHSRLLAQAVSPGGRVLAFDQDIAMLELAQPGFVGLPVETVHANFERLTEELAARSLKTIDGLVADLGFCSDQMADSTRGLSFQSDGPLDMRLDRGPHSGETAAEFLNRAEEKFLADVFWRYGEERFSRRVAKRIVETRGRTPLETTSQLADLVRGCIPRGGQKIDPATRVFQALRIAVNDELGCLERLLADLPRFIRPGGRAAIISFHSLEDRLVKQAFRDESIWERITRKPAIAADDETTANARARSAKLRVVRRK